MGRFERVEEPLAGRIEPATWPAEVVCMMPDGWGTYLMYEVSMSPVGTLDLDRDLVMDSPEGLPVEAETCPVPTARSVKGLPNEEFTDAIRRLPMP
jgi:hypothetical protein